MNHSSNAQTLAGLVVATGLVCALILALQHANGRRFGALLAPFGRLALTNYVLQTLIVLAVSWALGVRGVMTYRQAWVLWIVVCGAQIVASRLWLDRFRYGPLEWVWRWSTYGRRPVFTR